MKGEEKPYQKEFNSVQEVSEKKKEKRRRGGGVGSLIQYKAELKIPM